jgi:hypothetical protein
MKALADRATLRASSLLRGVDRLNCQGLRVLGNLGDLAAWEEVWQFHA